MKRQRVTPESITVFTFTRLRIAQMDIARQRLHRTFLVDRRWTTGSDVVRALGAVQAQDYEGAKWALSMRTTAATDAAIEREFESGAILRTHVLRPTWHFVDPTDIRWMLALTGPRVMKTMATYDRKLGLDERVFRRSRSALTKALRDADLTRTELKAVLEPKVGPLGGGVAGVQRTAHLMMRAELEGVICSGPRRGKQFTYALLDRRVRPAAILDRDEALLELTRRYFRTRSPATPQDFSWWSGLPMADVRRGIDLARAELELVSIDNVAYWVHGDTPSRAKPSAWLLPNYDEFFIGYRDRSAIGVRLDSVQAVTGGNALIANVIAMDGQLVGGWRRTLGTDRIRLDLQVLTRLSAAEQKRVMAEVRRYEAFAGKPVNVNGLR